MSEAKYYVPDKEENTRLRLQNQVVDRFDYDIYEDVLGNYDSFNILDVGCGSGVMIVPKVKKFDPGQFFGIDRSELQINRAREKFPETNIHFECIDTDSDEFEIKLKAIMEQYYVEQFDVINLSMVLLHMKDPQRTLRILHSYLKNDGTIIIRDIDDGLNFSYPDDQQIFKKICEIVALDDITGNRYCGRTIYHHLEKAGYSHIELRRMGLSTSGLDDELKNAFYEMSYKAMMDRTEIMAANHPDEQLYKDNALWVKENEEKAFKQFMQKDFVSSLGFMSYTAKK